MKPAYDQQFKTALLKSMHFVSTGLIRLISVDWLPDEHHIRLLHAYQQSLHSNLNKQFPKKKGNLNK
jgi:hypothetical protein